MLDFSWTRSRPKVDAHNHHALAAVVIIVDDVWCRDEFNGSTRINYMQNASSSHSHIVYVLYVRAGVLIHTARLPDTLSRNGSLQSAPSRLYLSFSLSLCSALSRSVVQVYQTHHPLSLHLIQTVCDDAVVGTTAMMMVWFSHNC